jgi:glutamate-5-semialdehyde dehydrogenase
MSLTNGSPEEAAKAAKTSSRTLAILSTEDRNSALQSIHDALFAAKTDILAANARDLEIATRSAADGELSQSMVKRLDLSRQGKFEDMLKGILDVKGLDDPGMFCSFLFLCSLLSNTFLQVLFGCSFLPW